MFDIRATDTQKIHPRNDTPKIIHQRYDTQKMIYARQIVGY
jgi:hypothetical protein